MSRVGRISNNNETVYRKEIDSLVTWCKDNNLPLNVSKMKELVIDFRERSRGHVPICINGAEVEMVESFMFLRTSVVKKAFSTLACIAQTFEYRSWDIMLRLDRMVVRPLLEYCVQFWFPCLREDIIKLEKIQKRFTRMLPGLEGLSYKERLDRLALLLLKRKKLRGDLIEVYKIMRGINKVNDKCLFLQVRDFMSRGQVFKREASITGDTVLFLPTTHRLMVSIAFNGA
eukprot:g38393.t1